MLDLVEALRPHAENGFEPEHAPERLGEVRHIVLDCSRAQGELGWDSTVDVPTGLAQTLSSLRDS